ncbi:hypothetical protein BD410DRAFT_91691 [Rickenella mellea]|uniref:DUF6533 domain-containing protein n=1 Tax=Rickenella mellea TaxID=50990 RepID=A0A4Y7QA88_9AGAM|nr:hypothetical protein BD410DRAFT_91691 [Rickenella mellea]
MSVESTQLAIELNVNHYFSVASFALLYYDYFLTIEQEIKFFWGRRVAFASGLFFACRYLALFGNVPVILQTFAYWSPDVNCRLLQRYHQILSMTIQTIVGFILITRTYALYQRSRRILAVTCFTAVCVIIFGCWSVTRVASTVFVRPALPNEHGCSPRVDSSVGRRYAAAWAGVVVFDTEILILTLWKTVKMWKIGGGRLVHTLIRDGCTYYAVLTMANTSQILTFLVSPFTALCP